MKEEIKVKQKIEIEFLTEDNIELVRKIQRDDIIERMSFSLDRRRIK